MRAAAMMSVETQIQTLLDRIMNASSTSVVGAYENRISQLEQKKLELTQKSAQNGQPTRTFEEMFERGENGGLEYKRMVLRLVFADNLAYTRGIGYRTPKTTIPFKVLEGFSDLKSKMVRPRGLSAFH